MNQNVVYLAEYSICSVLREKVYRSKIADVNEPKTRLSMSEHADTVWGKSIVDAAVSQ